MFKTRIYGIWRGMMQRCENKRYVNYHGRGIKVCERWHNFDNFYNDTKEGYSDSLSLDRYPDKNGNYEPLNFRWATSKQQGRNTRSNVILEYAGERLIIAEWAEKLKISHKIISSRISLGWEIERVLTEPVYFSKGKNQFGNNKKITQCQQVCP